MLLPTDLLSNIKDLADMGIISEEAAIAAEITAMEKLNKLKKQYVDAHHEWNERDFLPRYKPRGDGKIVEYYLTHINVNKHRKRITAGTLDELYLKLYDFYAVEAPTNIKKNATLRDVFLIYRELRRVDAEENKTISTQTYHYDEVIWNKYFEDSKLADMHIIDISQMIVLNEYKRITGPGNITRKAFNKIKSLMDAIFDIALSEGVIANNPSRVIPKSRLKFKVPNNNSNKVYSKEDREKLISYLKNQEQTVYTLAVRLAFCFPLRIGELRALTWEDINLEDQTILVWHEIVDLAYDNKSRTATDVPHTKTNTTDGIRILAISDEAAIILRELHKINKNNKYILQSKGKMPITTNHFNEHLRSYCKACDIPYFSSHKIRFYGATEMFNAGIDPEMIRRTLGHTTIAMSEHYNRTNGNININKDTWNDIFGSKSKKV